MSENWNLLLPVGCLQSQRYASGSLGLICSDNYMCCFTEVLLPIAPDGAINDPSPPHSVLGCSGHSRPVGPLLFQLCFSVSPPNVVRPASLSLPLRVPGQGLVCGDGCWLPEGVSDPAPLPLQYLLGHWFLSCSLPQIFISELHRDRSCISNLLYHQVTVYY